MDSQSYNSSLAASDTLSELKLSTDRMNVFTSSLFLWLYILFGITSGKFVGYPRPSIYEKSAHFSLKVNGTDMYTVGYAEYDYVQLSMDEGYSTEFRVGLLDESSVDSYNISPKKLAISATKQGNELVFSLKEAQYLIVKINDEKEFVILVDPSETDVPNTSASNVYNVKDYDADGTGASLTKGVQSALDAAASHPGSIVYVPPGLYIFPNLYIHSQTSLYLAGGAVLRMSDKPSDYKTLFNKSDDGDGTWWIRTDADSKDIKIYGRGTIDGNGEALFNLKPRFIADLLVPVGTTNFKCDGILVRDASFWAVVPIQVTGAKMTNIKILDRFSVLQNDGIDVVESTDVVVDRAIAIANDDNFSTKTWPYKKGTTMPYPYEPRPLSNVSFNNCIAWTLRTGFKVGMGVFEDQDNVNFNNSVAYSASIGLGIQHAEGTATASHIRYENIHIENLAGTNDGRATWLAIYIIGGSGNVGSIENVFVHNIKADDLGAYNSLIQGYSSSVMVSTVTLENIYANGSSKPATTLDGLKVVDTQYSEGIRLLYN